VATEAPTLRTCGERDSARLPQEVRGRGGRGMISVISAYVALRL
jgi:hypothetical protein